MLFRLHSCKSYLGSMQGKFLKILCFAVLSFFWAAHSNAQPIAIPRIDTTPTIDGMIQTEEWGKATRVTLEYETSPGENITPPVKTEAFLMEDGETLFVAFIAHDSNTSDIRAYYRDHDRLRGHDSVGVVLDTFNDERQAFEFFVNPLGIQRDVINDDINKRQDGSWDALWESGGKINDDNYTVEMAIPFNQLRFNSSGEKQTWGIDLVRQYPREKFYRIGLKPLDRNISCYLCQLEKASGFDQLQPSLNLVVTPTLTANATETRSDPATDLSWESGDSDPEASLDVRWGINQSLYLNATINPDFSQVEADNAQLNVNTTFSLFFPERRTFFLDGASYFNSRLNIVHTRNIAEPDFGVKLTGKNNGNSYGLLTARDKLTSFVIPGNQRSGLAILDNTESDVFVGRYRRDIGEDYTLGVLVTDRQSDDYANTVVGIDGIFQFTDSDRVQFQGLQSESKNPLQLQDPINSFGLDDEQSDHAFTVQYRHNDRRWNWFTKYDDFGEDFRADLGFITRVDFTKKEIGGGHTWNLDEFPFSRIQVGGNWDESEAQDGLKLEEELEGFVAFQNGPLQSFVEFGGGERERFYDGQYFDEKFYFIVTGSQVTSDLRLFFLIDSGKVIDFSNTQLGESGFYRVEMNYRFGRHLNTSLNYSHNRFTVDNGLLFTAKLTDMRATYQFNSRSFLRLSLQYSNTNRDPLLYVDPVDATDKDIATQLLYSYKINAQSRFFVGYSDGGFQDDQLDAIKKTNRTFFVKASYAWQP